ncbi:MAG: TolC family protein [Candidatus Pseudobacter hemicellulosilyticus]|uniref:TolC family protein n=1 Tax=Candidatus Pseudobacter hemicellulosilyticus TaxID=3121375 RepID=A0AAJ5WQE2_9BACT|nr:MAG: TolC family protein [Pseudobacter sp.]
MKPGKVLWLAGLILLTATTLRAQSTPAPTLTLRQCVETALQNNMDARKAELDRQRAEVNLRGAKGQMLPYVSGSVEHTLYQGRSIDLYTNSYTNQSNKTASYYLGGDMTIFNGFRLFNNLRSNQYLLEAGVAMQQQTRDQLTLDVILAYLAVLSNTDLLKIQEAQVAVTSKQVERLEVLNREGAIKPSDFYDMKGQLAGEKVSYINTLNSLNDARLRLSQLMNMPYREDLQVERLPTEAFEMGYNTGPDSIYQAALVQLALVKTADLLQKSAVKDLKSARGSLFPTVGIGGGINTNFSGAALDSAEAKIPYYDQLSNNYSTNVGFVVRIPLLNGFNARNQVARARINLKQTEFESENVRIQLQQSVERDHLNMRATLNRYQVLVEQVASYQENFRAAEVRFNAGASNSVDYLIAKNKLDNANSSLVIARYEYAIRTRILDYYQGKLMW